VEITAATPSGHPLLLQLARGDQVRFLARDDDLGVINGSVATITRVKERRTLNDRRPWIEAEVEGRRISFDPMQLADAHGRPRLGWAYASTIAGAQGLTVDRAVVLVDPAFNRHDIYVAASRARGQTTLVVDAKGIDRRLTSELPFDEQRDDLAFSEALRRRWLAERLSRASPKTSTLDVIESTALVAQQLERQRRLNHELGHEL
jgi:ATP-dependent exoDNAse (exonuclease V) alpha subunit